MGDRYLLRDLARCGLCDVVMTPALLSTRVRFYGCTNRWCPRPLVSAELLEVLVWQAFRYRFTESAMDISVGERARMLGGALERVSVGVDMGDVRYQWRGLP
jgi:hypothetical protein